MATSDERQSTRQAANQPAYDTFDDYMRLVIKEYYDRGWKNRRGNFVALLIASGQALNVAREAVSGDHGLKNMAMGAAGVVALRLAVRWALGGPLGVLVTAATVASLVAYFAKNQKEIRAKIDHFRVRIEEERGRFEEIQSGYRANRYDARERSLMIDGQLSRFLSDLDEA